LGVVQPTSEADNLKNFLIERWNDFEAYGAMVENLLTDLVTTNKISIESDSKFSAVNLVDSNKIFIMSVMVNGQPGNTLQFLLRHVESNGNGAVNAINCAVLRDAMFRTELSERSRTN